MRSGNRVFIWDNIKFVLIVAVVLGHLIPMFNDYVTPFYYQVRYFIYTFHMPLFFFISGLFSKNAIARKDVSKVIKYLNIYLLMKMWTFAAGTLISGKMATFELLKAANAEWFMLVLAFSYIVTFYLQRYSRVEVFIFTIILGCYIGYDSTTNDLFAIARCITFYPFFFAGYCIDSSTLLAYLKKKEAKVLSLILISAYIMLIRFRWESINWISNIFTGHAYYDLLKHYQQFGGILAFIWYLLAFAISFSIISLMPERKLFFTAHGVHTLPVYVFHGTGIYIMIYWLHIHKQLNRVLPIIGYKWIIPSGIFIAWVLSYKCVAQFMNKMLLQKK